MLYLENLEPDREDQSAVSTQVAVEREWHDQQFAGRRRNRWIGTGIHDWLYSDRVARSADRYMASLVKELSQPGQKVLEYGCGTDPRLSILLKDAGVQTIAFDVSFVALTKASQRSNAIAQGPFLFNAAAERLPIPSESVDLVIGESVLHHLCLRPALIEISRVLRRGGLCIFREPLKGSPLVRLFRWLTPGDRTATEKPFEKSDFELIREFFALRQREDFFLLAPISVPFALLSSRFATRLWNMLVVMDNFLIHKWPALRWWCWQTVVVFQKSQ